MTQRLTWTTSSKFALHLGGLWLIVVCLAAITSFSLVANVVRSDCQALPARNVTAVVSDVGALTSCSTSQWISYMVLREMSFLQSIHTVAFQLAVTAALLVFQPALRALVWSSLEMKNERQVPSLRSLHSRIQLSTSPGLMPGIADAWSSRRLGGSTALVILLGILSLVAPVAISPIYRPREGALRGGNIDIMIGGGVGPDTDTSYNPDSITPGGVVSGRALLNSATVTGTSLNSFSYSPAVIPFLDMTQIPKIASAIIETVVAYQSVDCGPTAPARLSSPPDPGQYVNVSDTYWTSSASAGQALVSSGGVGVGYILNDPHISAFYVDGVTTSEPGWTNSTTSVILLAANGTLVGAQQQIFPPRGVQARTQNIDVLICTSTTSLGISTCVVSDGRFIMCTPLTAEAISEASPNSTTSIIESHISNPNSTSMILSASPVLSFFWNCGMLPMYGPSQTQISIGQVPLSYLTAFTTDPGYSIPLSYVTDVLFHGTSLGLVLGMNAAWPFVYEQRADLIVYFSTSFPELQVAILAIAVLSAIITTLSALRSKSRKAAEINVTRLLAISRDHRLDDSFAPFADRTVGVPREMEEMKVRYRYLAHIERHALELWGVETSLNLDGLGDGGKLGDFVPLLDRR